jgi:hypothetical protein
VGQNWMPMVGQFSMPIDNNVFETCCHDNLLNAKNMHIYSIKLIKELSAIG